MFRKGKQKSGCSDGDDQSQVTAATFDSKLSADTLKANQQPDDVSVLQEDESFTLSKLEGGEEGKDHGGDWDDQDEGGSDDDDDDNDDGIYEEEEKKVEGDEEEEDGDNMSALTANTKNTTKATVSQGSSSQGTKRSLLSKLTPGFMKKSPQKITSTRRFSISGIRRFSLAHRKDTDNDTVIEPYEPALKFHERMAKRREKFRTRKERVAETVENAEHNKLNIEDYVVDYN